MSRKTYSTNRKAQHDYEILDVVEAGIVLTGTEIKSVVNSKLSLEGSYAHIRDGEIWLVGSRIEELKGAVHNHVPDRSRKLLLHAKQLKKLDTESSQPGHSLVPLSMYSTFDEKRGGYGKAKIELALVKGKTHSDKRESLKAKEAKREMDRAKKK